MPVLSLDLKPPPPDKPVVLPSGTFRYRSLTFHAINTRAFPLRGLVYSVMLHEIMIGAMMFYSVPFFPRHLNWPDKQWDMTMVPKDVLYLPRLGGGRKGESPKKADGGALQGAGGRAAADTTRGVTYAGKQKIVSNPPNPTSHIQTILHPDLPNPPTLKSFVPLPNMMILAQAPPPPPPPPIVAPEPKPAPKVVEPPPPQRVARNEPQVRVPVVSLSGPQPVETPKLTLPVTPTETNVPLHATPAPPRPAPPTLIETVTKVKPVPSPPQVLPVGGNKGGHNLLVLSPMSVPVNPAPKIPEGEARGQFTISPQSSSEPSLTGPGSAASATSANALALGGTSGSTVGDATGSGAAGHRGRGDASGNGAGNGGESTGSGSGGRGGGGSGEGAGTSAGSGAGHGSGTGSGTGTGAGAGPGAGPFAGMTIQGGEGPAGAIAISGGSNPPAAIREEGSYGLTIVSTGNSGGGVGDFGVFNDEAVFTVYLSPASTPDDPAPPWSLQYAILNTAGLALRDLLPPFALKKPAPAWPADLLTRYRGQQLAVYAVIDVEGKMQHLKVLQSPSARLSEGLVTALEQWVFRPARMNGKPVAVKVVLGVPVPSAQ